MKYDVGRIKFIISDDPDFDITRMKSIHGSHYINIYDTVTRKMRLFERARVQEIVFWH
jgi:hypothetical protein